MNWGIERTVATVLAAALLSNLCVHVLSASDPKRPPDVPSSSDPLASKAIAASQQLAPRQLSLAGLPSEREAPNPKPADNWHSLADYKLEHEVANLRGVGQVNAYLDRLLGDARQRGAITPVETFVGHQAIESLSEVSVAQRQQLLLNYEERVIALQTQLQGQPARRASGS